MGSKPLDTGTEMSATVEISIQDNASDALRQLERELTPRQLAATAGPPLQRLTRDHLAALPSNKHGWPSTGLWEQAARHTRFEITDSGVKIIVDWIGVRQRWKGGHIGPVRAQALAIPISPLSYGKTPADFPGSFLLKTPKGAFIAMYGNEGVNGGRALHAEKRRRRVTPALRATIIILFKLSSGVDQVPNPDVIPTMEAYLAVTKQAALARLAAVKGQQKAVNN